MPPLLNQIVAIANGKKTHTKEELTQVYHKIQKPELFAGVLRTYHPDTEEGEKFPQESKNVQYTVKEAIRQATAALTDLFDITATQDWGNCQAKGDVVVEGKVILSQVPVTYLLFLEKQLVDVQTLISKLPTLDPADTWSFNSAQDCFASQPSRTSKTKKVMRNHVKAEATDKFPAQVDVFTEDVKQGEWNTIKFSGAANASDRNKMLERTASLIEAVKIAREVANSTPVDKQSVGAQVFSYLFPDAVSNQPIRRNPV